MGVAGLAAGTELEKATHEAAHQGQVDRIQKIVDDRQLAKRARDFKKADALRTELRNMGVELNDKDFTWTGPGGISGSSRPRDPGDWDCPLCGQLVFVNKDRCVCGGKKDGGRQSPSYGRPGKDR